MNNTYIEFFGLTGEFDKYDLLVEKKLKMIAENKFNLIQIYPKDLFPVNKLSQLLKRLF